jgi:hypothetical protein
MKKLLSTAVLAAAALAVRLRPFGRCFERSDARQRGNAGRRTARHRRFGRCAGPGRCPGCRHQRRRADPEDAARSAADNAAAAADAAKAAAAAAESADGAANGKPQM